MSRPTVHARPGRPLVAVPSTRTQLFAEATSTSQWRSKSRSPSRGAGTRTDPFTLSASPQPTQPFSFKRKRSLTSLGNSTGSIVIEDADRGQRVKPKPSSSLHSQNRQAASGSSASSSRHRKDRDRWIAPDAAPTGLQLVAPPIRRVDKGKEVAVASPTPPPQALAGSLAVAEYERMRRELEQAKKALHDNKKHIKKQNKTIEELKTQLASDKQLREQQEQSLTTTQAKLNKNEALVQSIESSLQCQICIELVVKPHLLVPCGHILCMGCLQQWFRAAPSEEEEDDAMDDPNYFLHREKKCPCCRGRVVRRPVPVFLLKDVVNAINPPAAGAGAVELGDDPWKGLFDSDYDSDGEGDDDDMEDEDMDDYEYSDGSASEYRHGFVDFDIFGQQLYAEEAFNAAMFDYNYTIDAAAGSDTDGEGDGGDDEDMPADSRSGSESGSGGEGGYSDEEEYYAAAEPADLWGYDYGHGGYDFEADFGAWQPPPAEEEEEEQEVQNALQQVNVNAPHARWRTRRRR